VVSTDMCHAYSFLHYHAKLQNFLNAPRILQELPYMLSNVVNFGSQMAENGWRALAHP